MTKSPVTPVRCFTKSNAADDFLTAKSKGAKEAVLAQAKAAHSKNRKKSWGTLVRYMTTNDTTRLELSAYGTSADWQDFHSKQDYAKKPKAPAKKAPVKAAPKPKAPAKAPVSNAKAAVSSVDAAKALAVLIGAGMADSAEARTLMSFIKA
tara:strand:- start:2380 stop:2832 length:453 start_codon:yes stop_codon:yes gene_type:complete